MPRPEQSVGPPVRARIDLHCHSNHSDGTSRWLAQRFGLRDSYTDPEAIYRLAKERGMTHVTLTDHHSIEGALRLARYPDFIIGEEVTTYFPGDALHVRVLVWGIDERQHEEIGAVRYDIHQLVGYLREQGIAHGLAHPFSIVNGGVSADHVEALLDLFTHWEARNGLASPGEHRLALDVAAHAAARGGEAARALALFGGSDDHSGLDAGTTFTEIRLEPGGDLLTALRAGAIRPRGSTGSTPKLAHTAIAIALKGGQAIGGMTSAIVRGASRSTGLWDVLADPRSQRLAGRLLQLAATFQRSEKSTGASMLNALMRETSDGLKSGQFLPGGLRHEHLEALAEAVWSRTMQEQLATLSWSDLDPEGFSTAQWQRLAESQALLTPYLLAAGYHARQQRHADRLAAELSERHLASVPPASTSPRVAMFTDTFDEVNGVATVLHELVDHAVAEDWPFTVVTAGPEAASKPGRVVLPAVWTSDLDLYRGFPFALLPVLETLAWCEKNRIEVIHAATPGPVGMVAWLLASSLDVPFVATYHTDLPRLGFHLTRDHMVEEALWGYVRLFYDQCDVVLCPSSSTIRDLKEHRVRSRLEPFDQAVDLERFSPSHRDAALHESLAGDKSILLWVGRISPEKGLDMLLKAYVDLRSRRDDLLLVIVGDGPDRERLSAIAGDTVFLGNRFGDELATLYASADIFVFPGRAETFGQVVLEAAASGLPAVITAGTGVDDVVSRNETALTVTPGDSKAFAAAIDRLLDDADLRSRMGTAARLRAEQRTWPATFARLKDMYDGLPR